MIKTITIDGIDRDVYLEYEPCLKIWTAVFADIVANGESEDDALSNLLEAISCRGGISDE